MTPDTTEEIHHIEAGSAMVRGVRVWFAVFGGVVAWTAHLMFSASFVRFTCNRHGVSWVMHAVTAGTAAVTVAAMVLANRLRATAGDFDEEAGSAGGRLHFLGLLGVLVGAINLALILVEGSYVVFLKPCG